MIRTLHSRVRLGGHHRLIASVSAPSPLTAGASSNDSASASGHNNCSLSSSSNFKQLSPPSLSYHPTTQPSRSFWSSSSSSSKDDEINSNTTTSIPSCLLPAPPLTPSNISAASLLSNSTIESLQSLPEIKSALDTLYPNNNNPTTTTSIQQVHTNLQRARDILQSLPELHSATYLISMDLYALQGRYDLALESLARYNHHSLQQQQQQTKGKNKHQQLQLQFLKAKMYLLSGQFTHALSEYEDLLDIMEQRIQHQMKNQQKSQASRGVSVIDGAATLTGVGLTKLFLVLHHDQQVDTATTTTTTNEIMEAIETSTEMLLESRRDALNSPQHATLALDLGIAASISLTNLGIVHCTLRNNKVKSIELWKEGLDTLDNLLGDAMNMATIIPRHKFLWMESLRARLHCDIACLLLGLEEEQQKQDDGELKMKKQLEEETLKHASEAAKKGLDIYDELINGAKILRDGGSDDTTQDEKPNDNADDDDDKKEWERVLKEEVKKKQESTDDDDEDKPPEVAALSQLWIDYHRCESARALGLVAHCYAQAGAAVTSEGLFQSALDASASYPMGKSLRSTSNSNVVVVAADDGKGIALSSPNLGLIARDVRVWYAMLCNNWEKRKGDADRLLADAQRIDEEMIFQGYSALTEEERKKEKKKRISGMLSSLWLFNPIDFERN